MEERGYLCRGAAGAVSPTGEFLPQDRFLRPGCFDGGEQESLQGCDGLK